MTISCEAIRYNTASINIPEYYVPMEAVMKVYRAYVIIEELVFYECTVVAKDETGAKVKAILAAACDPDTAHVLLHRVGEIPQS